MLRGTGVSEGCGIGKALIIQHRSLDYSGVVFGGAQQEKERLRAAINAFMQKTEQLRDRLQASAREKEAAILDGHMEMLRDPFMLSQMEEMIDGGATAEAAADGVCNQFIAMFSGMDDELIAEAEKLGFSRFILPDANLKGLEGAKRHIELVPVHRVEEALRALFG